MDGIGSIGSWAPGSPRLGLVAVPLYVLGAWRCARLAGAHRVELVGREAICWRSLSAALLALGIFKLLDLQTALTAIGRSVASEHDWYTRRRPLQFAIIAGVAAAGAGGAAICLWLARRMPPSTWVAVVGGFALVAFVAVRTISFHAVDQFLSLEYVGLRLNWVIELGGIVIILAAARWRRSYRSMNMIK